MTEALTSDRAYDALDVGVLPRRSRRCEDFVDLHRADGGYDVRECGVAGLVPRCGMAGISADGVVYVGALKFDTPCDLPWPERFRKD